MSPRLAERAALCEHADGCRERAWFLPCIEAPGPYLHVSDITRRIGIGSEVGPRRELAIAGQYNC